MIYFPHCTSRFGWQRETEKTRRPQIPITKKKVTNMRKILDEERQMISSDWRNLKFKCTGKSFDYEKLSASDKLFFSGWHIV